MMSLNGLLQACRLTRASQVRRNSPVDRNGGGKVGQGDDPIRAEFNALLRCKESGGFNCRSQPRTAIMYSIQGGALTTGKPISLHGHV